MRLLLQTLITAAGFLALLAESVATANERKPNVIVILADDLGYGDLSCYGADDIATTNIDRMA
ncbi:MAG: steryl-sulfatase, partial [Planctomycetota bacterium]